MFLPARSFLSHTMRTRRGTAWHQGTLPGTERTPALYYRPLVTNLGLGRGSTTVVERRADPRATRKATQRHPGLRAKTATTSGSPTQRGTWTLKVKGLRTLPSRCIRSKSGGRGVAFRMHTRPKGGSLPNTCSMPALGGILAPV